MNAHPASKRRRLLTVLGLLAGCLIAATGLVGARAAPLATSSVWPKFSTPRVVFVADASTLDPADLITATTLQGVYNGGQRPTRLYLDGETCAPCGPLHDDFWLAHTLPNDVQAVKLPPPSDGDVLKALLVRFRPSIAGAVETDPSNPDTVNLASTLAGLDHAIVIDPGQESLIRGLGIPVLYSFNSDAFTAMNRAQTYEWGVGNLLPRTSTQLLVELSPTITNIRDYGVATRSFFYELTSTDPAQLAVIHQVLAHTPANTPIMGWVPNENADVADLSAQGHFLNASNAVTNDSVWASMPSPAALHQPAQPAPIAAQPNTVYVAFLVSDGDNAYYMQNRMLDLWQDPNLGSVPAGWTVAPGTVDFDPTMLEYFNGHLPANNELVAGPSGIGYATEMSGSVLSSFVGLTNQIMAQADLHTVDNFEAGGDLNQYAQGFDQPSIAFNGPLVAQQTARNIAVGQTNPYIQGAQQLFCVIHQQSTTPQTGSPLFLEPLVDGWTLGPTDLVHIAQQLALAGKEQGVNYVFTTPTELALTMRQYYAGQEAGLPAANAQSVTGQQVLSRPLVSGSYPTGTVQVTGANVVTNPSGASGATGWTTAPFPSAAPNGTSSVTATTYDGAPALLWNDTITNVQSWVHYYPAVQNGNTYTFSVDVAGSGQVFLDAWSATRGAGDQYSLPVRLTSSYQHLTWTVMVPSYAPTGQTGGAPQLQLREDGVGPVSAYFKNASVEASTPAC